MTSSDEVGRIPSRFAIPVNDFKLKLLGKKAQHLARLLVSQMGNDDGNGLRVLTLDEPGKQFGIDVSQMFEGNSMLFFIQSEK